MILGFLVFLLSIDPDPSIDPVPLVETFKSDYPTVPNPPVKEFEPIRYSDGNSFDLLRDEVKKKLTLIAPTVSTYDLKAKKSFDLENQLSRSEKKYYAFLKNAYNDLLLHNFTSSFQNITECFEYFPEFETYEKYTLNYLAVLIPGIISGYNTQSLDQLYYKLGLFESESLLSLKDEFDDYKESDFDPNFLAKYFKELSGIDLVHLHECIKTIDDELLKAKLFRIYNFINTQSS
jgi:hypothetical protein